MLRLSREIRFSLLSPEWIGERKGANTWAGWPSSSVVAPFLKLRCELEGNPDPATGYLCNIKVIDDILQLIVNQDLNPHYLQNPLRTEGVDLIKLAYKRLSSLWSQTDGANGSIKTLTLETTPFLNYSIQHEEPEMVEMTQQFEFSAAHRLNCPQMSEAENQAFFGKCNNPNGHGHNYLVDVTVGSVDGSFDLQHFERTVKEHVIDRLDHQHLNQDDDYFGRVNPSVENICSAIFGWLTQPLHPLLLRRVRVYETPKTWAQCDSAPAIAGTKR